MVHPKMKILSSFTHPHVVPNLYEFLLKIVGNRTVDSLLTSIVGNKYHSAVIGYCQQLFHYIIFFCFQQK